MTMYYLLVKDFLVRFQLMLLLLVSKYVTESFELSLVTIRYNVVFAQFT